MSEDKRRKLSPSDYQLIRFDVLVMGHTIRQEANQHGISTKFVKKLISTTNTEAQMTFTCSGCLYQFTGVDLQNHFAIYTSGFTKPLECGQLIVR